MRRAVLKRTQEENGVGGEMSMHWVNKCGYSREERERERQREREKEREESVQRRIG